MKKISIIIAILVYMVLNSAQIVSATNWISLNGTFTGNTKVYVDTDSLQCTVWGPVYSLWHKVIYKDGSYTLYDNYYDIEYRLYLPMEYVQYDKNNRLRKTVLFTGYNEPKYGMRRGDKRLIVFWYSENGEIENALWAENKDEKRPFRPIFPGSLEEALFNVLTDTLKAKHNK